MTDISTVLGFPKRQNYKKVVRHRLAEDDDARSFRELFDNLFEQ